MKLEHTIENTASKCNCIIRGIDGFPDYYVSDTGFVFSKRKKKNLTKLKSVVASNGYLMITLIDEDGKRYYKTVHRIVMMTFASPPPTENHDVCHVNGVRTDCRLSNLRWGTRAENMTDCIRHGTICRGEKRGNSVLTEEKVRSIQKDNRLHRIIAEEHGVSRRLIGEIKQGKRWRHVS